MCTIESLEQRLQAIEHDLARDRKSLRTYRRLSACLALALVGGISIAAESMTPIADVIQTRRLEIVTSDGKLLLAASGSERGGQLDIWNRDGQNTIRASCNSHGGDVALWNSAGS